MFSTLMNNIVDDTSGATAIEYGLIVALIGIAIIGSVTAMAGEVNEMWSNTERDVTNAIGNGPFTPPVD